MPFFCTSIGLARNGVPYAGVIFAPVTQELFWAEKGKGSWLNGDQIKVNDEEVMVHASIGYCHGRKGEGYKTVMKAHDGVKLANGRIRQYGAGALELAYVASGRIESFMSFGLGVWDVTAGIVIVRESGGIVTDASGIEFNSDSTDIVASNKNIHFKILKNIKDSIN